MTDNVDFRNFFFAGVLALILIAAAPTLALFVRIPSGSERFSELWLLGSEHEAGDFPFNVETNKTYSVYVSVGNKLGQSAYYRVLVKFRNQTQPVPAASNSSPSVLPALYEYAFFVAAGDTWESKLSFQIDSIERTNNHVTVKRMSVNKAILTFDPPSQAIWDSQRTGFYYQMFLELWRYDLTSQVFKYDNRFVGFWLNITNAA